MTEHVVTREFLQKNPLPLPQGESDKDARGRVVAIGGHRENPGAVHLAGISALRAGAGKLQIATCQSVAIALGIALPEARVRGLAETEGGEIDTSLPDKLAKTMLDADAVLIGPGMIDDERAGKLAKQFLSLAKDTMFVIDAAALTGLRHHLDAFKPHAGRLVLTPHAGEMATFLGIDRDEVLADPAGIARRAAQATHAVVIMKGSCSYIASPQGQIWACAQGNIGLGTSGSGDTLAGIIAGLLARGAPPLLAAQWGVYMHGEAGQRLKDEHGLLGYLASEIPFHIPAIMKEIADQR